MNAGRVIAAAVLVCGLVLGALIFGRHPAEPQSAVSAEDRHIVAGVIERLAASKTASEAVGDPRILMRAGKVADAAAALERAVAAAPDRPEPLLALAILSLRQDRPLGITHREAAAIVAVLGESEPGADLLPAARAWLAISQDDPLTAMAALEGAEIGLDAAAARLRVAQMLGQDPGEAGRALLALDPTDPDACGQVARASFAAGDLDKALQAAKGCEATGGPAIHRLVGDIQDRVGHFAEARAAYDAGGAFLHGAAIAMQEGASLTADELAALQDKNAPVALPQLWWAVLSQNAAALESVRARLAEGGAQGAAVDVALGAAALAAGHPEEARLAVAELDGPAALVLRGRASAALGDETGAKAAFDEALRARPWSLDILRERLAAQPASLDDAVALLALDPVLLFLARDLRERDTPWVAVAPSPWPDGPESLVGAVGLVTQGLSDEGLLAPATEHGALVHESFWALRRGQLDLANAFLSQSAQDDPPDPRVALLQAELARANGDPASAITALIAEPLDAPGPAWVVVRALADLGKIDEARSRAHDAAIANPELSGLWALALDPAAP